MVIRHGERAPEEYYPLLADGKQFAEEEGAKALTEHGAETMYKFGQSLR